MGFWETIDKLLTRAKLASLTASIIIVGGTYAFYNLGHTEGLMFVLGGAVGFLYGKEK